MARKIISPANYPSQFSDGQGVGLPDYSAYPVDLQTCFEEILAVTDQAIDELNAARLGNTLISEDILKPRGISNGRFSADQARITATDTPARIEITSGLIFIGNTRFNIVGQVFDQAAIDLVSPGADILYLNIDQGGLLSLTVTVGAAFFDLAEFDFDGGTAFNSVTDNLNPVSPLNSGFTVNRIQERLGAQGGAIGVDDPSIRLVGIDGVEQDAGFYHLGSPSEMGYASQNDGGEGSGSPVTAIEFRAEGQMLLLQQARAIATSTAVNAGTSGAVAALTLETPVRREPGAYLANPFFTPPAATAFTVPAGGQYDGTYQISGFVVFPSGTTGPELEADILAGGVVIARGRVAKTAGGDTVIPLSGFAELSGGNTIQIRAATAAVGAETVDCRLGAMLLGG